MSRTYRNKIRHGLFAGSNTAWYRARTRWLRNKHHHELRTALQYIEPDEVLCFTRIPKRDTYMEPTDGSMVVDNLFIQKVKNRACKYQHRNVKNYFGPQFNHYMWTIEDVEYYNKYYAIHLKKKSRYKHENNYH